MSEAALTTPDAEEPTGPSCYLVRTIPELVEKGIVGIGWSDFDFSGYSSAEEIIQMLNQQTPHGVGRYGNQIRRFFAMNEGDIVVAPLPYVVAIGRVTGGLLHDESYYDKDRANQRRVNFPRDATGQVITIPRTSFVESFQRRLRVMGIVVNDLGEFREGIVEALAKIKRGETYTWLSQLELARQREEDAFRTRLLENIRSGKTNLRTGGAGLEHLVQELLIREGYQASVLSKQQFESHADADIEASRSDRWSTVKLLVQVKHHQGFSDAHGLNQLLEIRKAHAGEYDEHLRVLVTSAAVAEELRKQATNEGIIVIDGQELAAWIGEHIAVLKKETKDALGIYEVPAVL